MVHWVTCWDTHVCKKLAHLDLGINAHVHLNPKLPCGHEPLLVSSWLVCLGKNNKIFEISQVSYFLWKLGTKVKKCALVSSVFDYFWIFGGPANFWPKRRRRQMMPRDWIFQNWNHFHYKTTHLDAENEFCKKSSGCYHVAIVQNWHSFRRFDRQLTGHKMDAPEVLRLNQMLKCEPYVP